MAINDYLSGINNATSGEKADVNTASTDLSALQTGAGALPAKLKEALNLKLNNNKDIIGQQSETMQNYFNSGAQAREKYQDVWDPFKKATLVQQDRSMALRPYDTLSGVLENRMGTVADTVTAGVQGWQGMVNAGQTKLDTAKSLLSTALQSYMQASDQQNAADDMAYKIEAAKEASRQFEQNYGLDVTKIENQVSQFNQEMGLKKGTLSAGTKKANQAISALQKDINAGVPFYELYPRYKDAVPEYEIRQAYNSGPMAKQYGGATESSGNLGRLTNLDQGAVSGYAQGLLMDTITMSSVPEEYRTEVAKNINLTAPAQ